MILQNRIIWEDDTTLKDLSVDSNNPKSAGTTLNFVTVDDYVYLGSFFPFNHKYFQVKTVNAVSAVASVDLWDGDSWTPAVDVVDESSVGGKSLAQSGVISFKLDKGESWVRQDTENMTGSGLETLKIFDLYWARLSFSATLTATTKIGYVGQKFTTDADLSSFYPELGTSNVRNQFESGLTSFETQHILAAEEVARELKRRNLLVSRDQVLEWRGFTQAAVHYVASIVWNAFGEDYVREFDTSRKLYKEAVDKYVFEIDRNKNTRLDPQELFPDVRVVRR